MVRDTKIDYGGDGGYVGGDGDGYGYDGVGYGGYGYGGGGYGGDGYGGYGYGGGGGGYGGYGYGGGGYGGDGYGDGCGGYGYGYGVGCDGCGGYGHGYGDGCYGYGGGGDGYGYGVGGYGELVYPESAAFMAYHYIKKTKQGYVMRNGIVIQEGTTYEEDEIEMCKRGLHSSMTPVEAKKYAPEDSVLTQVKVWGRVIFGEDKLVSTHRKLIEERK